MRIKFPVYGNMNLIATLKDFEVSMFYSPDSRVVVATFNQEQTHLCEHTKEILSRRLARKIGMQKQA